MHMHVYFSGIGGVGLGPLAEIALDAGYVVSGSDAQDSPMLERLRERGAKVHVGQDEARIRDIHSWDSIDWFVYTSALPKYHPELEFARRHGIAATKRHELLAHIIDEKALSLIAVSGTHGKTTTTAMLAWLAQEMGTPASYSVGTELNFGPSGRYDPDSQWFFYEADEYDRNFLSFHPHVSVITNVDFDHPDTYASVADYRGAFRQFIHQSQHVITWPEVAHELGLPEGKRWLTVAEPPVDGLKLPGAHNRQNAQLALETVRHLSGESLEELSGVINTYPGASRRFEKLDKNLYSDYGHHPVEISATLEMARELSDNVVLVYQPHQNRRQHELKDQYGDCMRLAEKVYWLPTYLTREDPGMVEVTAESLIENLHDSSHVTYAEMNDELWQKLQADRANDKLVLVMGAGDIDSWVRSKL